MTLDRLLVADYDTFWHWFFWRPETRGSAGRRYVARRPFGRLITWHLWGRP
jgi:hypothetical protein